MTRRLIATISALALLAGPIIMTAAAQTASVAEAAASQKSAHAAWTELLQTYVQPSADGINRFDYGGLKASTADRAALDVYIDAFATLDLAAMSRDEQYVTWVNAYNALTVQHIVGRYPVKSIRSGYLVGPWKQVKMTVAGRDVSLDEIEHGILREEWDEPRTHYAVNCASFGCPNLKATAWEAETLEEDLTEAAEAYVNHPRGVTVRRDGRLQVSTIYKWFKEDFGDSEAGVIAHLLDHADEELAAKIRANPDIRSYDYDWSLNDIAEASQ